MNLLQRLHDGNFISKTFPGKDKPRYAILSHTWGDTNDEVTYQDIQNETGKRKPGYDKIKFCAEQMAKDDLEYVWVDTCCINKTSSAELSEAIVSMFRWYQEAEKCYVYLSDVSCKGKNNSPTNEWMPDFVNCKWFTRGWTLQELIAPKDTVFFSRENMYLGDKHQLMCEISNVTGISTEVLQGKKRLSEITYDERVCWMEHRETQKVEDRAYSLQGLLGVHMAPCYGEGYVSAIGRLRETFLAIRSPLGYAKAKNRKRTAPKAIKHTKISERCGSMRPICRMYEPLVLLYSLVPTVEVYVPITLPTREQTSYLPLKIARRRFLEDLAFLCDYDASTDTVVAIAMQSHQQRQVLWVASNTTPKRQISDFVVSRLEDIQQLSTLEEMSRPQRAKRFLTACIEHAAPRINESIKRLVAALHQCRDHLEDYHPEEVPDLLQWANNLCQPNIADFCRAAYQCTRSMYMNTIGRLSLQLREQMENDEFENAFDVLACQLTLLGRRYQAAKAVIASGLRLPELNGRVEVCTVPTPTGLRLPPTDLLTNFDSITVRMGLSGSRLNESQRALAAMDVKHELSRHFHHNYNSGNIRPFVHAEVQLLDLFHTKQYSFFEDERFVACSRPACWSCSTYFTSHPGGVELSPLGRSICLSWRPPLVEDRHPTEIDKDRNETMHEFNKRSRREVLHHLFKSASISQGRSGFPTIAPDLELLSQNRKPTPNYLGLMSMLWSMVRPRIQSAVSRTVVGNDNARDEVDGRQQQQVGSPSRNCLEEDLDESDSEGGILISNCHVI